MKYLLSILVVLFLGCGGKQNQSQKIADLASITGRGEVLIELSNKLRSNFDSYLLSGYTFIAKDNRDSSMFYGGKVKATDEALDIISKMLNDVQLKIKATN